MPKFIAVHTIPIPWTKEQWMNVLKQELPVPKGVSWNLSYCDFKDGKIFCEWDAPNKEIIERGLKAIYLPVDAIYPVEVFNVAKKKFEG